VARALTLLLLAMAAPASAADADAEAKAHFEAGRQLYQSGDYRGAAREFDQGYKLAPRPQFLLNLGQAYRKLGDARAAREAYARWLAETPKGDPDRAEVEQVMAEMAAAAPATAPATPAATATAPAPVENRSVLRRFWWLWPIAGALLVGAAVLAIVVAAQPSGCSFGTIGCLDARR
jgi:tetratricopeptide (TPR) repeat protein